MKTIETHRHPGTPVKRPSPMTRRNRRIATRMAPPMSCYRTLPE